MNAADALHAAPLAAAWLAGLTGSVHCLAMCGGISGALAMRGRAASAGCARLAGRRPQCRRLGAAGAGIRYQCRDPWPLIAHLPCPPPALCVAIWRAVSA